MHKQVVLLPLFKAAINCAPLAHGLLVCTHLFDKNITAGCTEDMCFKSRLLVKCSPVVILSVKHGVHMSAFELHQLLGGQQIKEQERD